MQKIPTLFKRDPEDMRRVLPEVTPGCEWVIAGEGSPTRKYDGTCVMLSEDLLWWARREVKPGKSAPPHFVAVEHDENTGKTVGWEPIAQSPFAKFHALAMTTEFPPDDSRSILRPGTFELIGAKINGNPECCDGHALVPHAEAAPVHAPFLVGDVQGSFEALREALTGPLFAGVEGVVWHHPDGRMAKLKVRDFPGLSKAKGDVTT